MNGTVLNGHITRATTDTDNFQLSRVAECTHCKNIESQKLKSTLIRLVRLENLIVYIIAL